MAGRWYPGVGLSREAARAKKRRAEAEATAAAARKALPASCWTCKGPMPVVETPEDSWVPCCSESCHQAREAELERREEVRLARREGIPVATYRARKAKPQP